MFLVRAWMMMSLINNLTFLLVPFLFKVWECGFVWWSKTKRYSWYNSFAHLITVFSWLSILIVHSWLQENSSRFDRGINLRRGSIHYSCSCHDVFIWDGMHIASTFDGLWAGYGFKRVLAVVGFCLILRGFWWLSVSVWFFVLFFSFLSLFYFVFHIGNGSVSS